MVYYSCSCDSSVNLSTDLFQVELLFLHAICSLSLEAPLLGDRPQITNLATVAIVPVSHDVPLDHFTHELNVALNSIGEQIRKANF